MSLTIPRRYNGPPDSGNGGFVAGRVAEELLTALGRPLSGPDSPWVEVTLRTPPPLDTAYDTALVDSTLTVTVTDTDRVTDTIVAEARVLDIGDAPVPAVERVDRASALAAERRYEGLTSHPFPTCWVCGTDRPDGYHLQPGTVTDPADPSTADRRTACLWRVPPSATAAGTGPVPASAVWAALDCPGGWTALVHGRVVVLGRMTARVAGVPAVGDECLTMGRLLGTEGRKTWTATSVYSPDGSELARAHSTWIAIDLP